VTRYRGERTQIQPQHGQRRQQRRATTVAEQAAAAAAADGDSAVRSRQRRRRRDSAGVVKDVARLETAGATSRRCVDHDGSARRDTAAS